MRFEARVLLEKVRGKRVMFVGDSVNRNQWESMVCLLHSVIPPGRATWKMGAPLSVFYIQDYNATFEFYWSPFLVESNSDDSRNHSIAQRIIMPESISKHGNNWKSADFLVFNTYIWWMNSRSIKVLSSNWNNPNEAACALETTPISNASMALEMGTDRRLLEVAKKVINDTEIPVTLIDITALSEYRKDAHTSVYTIRQGKLLTPEQKADPATFADCLHWCLPGVPDTWNELLYAHIISNS
ncbi:protein eskimo 1 [Phtheirospermum japonicum]|uniref:Protein eskimo 1 n=1 Tax=Phtheirospermum japonicum TaxID=374723 RepID=A0A830CEP1_9LAMI|nr:protein eskimo 1 [Phtheirospermum japonicum]